MNADWHEILDLLNAQCRRFDASVVDRLETLLEQLEAPTDDQSKSLRSAVLAANPDASGGILDAICVEYARECKWPVNIDKRLSLGLCARVMAARDFAEFVCDSSLVEPDESPLQVWKLQNSRQQILQWLLVDYWHRAGICRAVYTANGESPPD